MVYANKSMLTNDMNASTIASRYPIWLAQYNSSATYTGAYSYWQYTSSGTVPGIEGRVDMNFYYSTDGSFSSKINIPVPTGETAPADAKIVYATHIQTYGWEKEETYDGGISGTVGQEKRLEAIKIRNNTGIEGSVEYQVHCKSFGWMEWTYCRSDRACKAIRGNSDSVDGTAGRAIRCLLPCAVPDLWLVRLGEERTDCRFDELCETTRSNPD